jgi:NlpC/P60 family putative phage cell wall peptidase
MEIEISRGDAEARRVTEPGSGASQSDIGAHSAPEESVRAVLESTSQNNSALPRLRVKASGDTPEIVKIARQWIGTPYVHQASLKGVGCDCLGLLRGIWRELHGEEPEALPPYSPDWAEATGAETLYMALKRHSSEAPLAQLAPGNIALFRMSGSSSAFASLHQRGRGPAKHCGIVGTFPPPFTGEGDREAVEGARRSIAPSASRADNALNTCPVNGGGKLTLIHARQNKRVSEEPLSPVWRAKLAYAFRL